MSGSRVDDAVTAGLLLGVPAALWSVAGLPDIGVAPSAPHLVGWAVLAAWAAWAWCMTGVLIDVVRMVRAADATLGTRHGALPRLAARLAGLVMAISSVSATLPASGASLTPSRSAQTVTTRAISAIPATPATTRPTPAPTEAPIPSVWTVSTGDCLWSIAERIEGDGEAWTLLANANLGHVMADGRIFTDPSLIYPGWVLVIPAAMTSPASPDTVVVPAPPTSAPAPAPSVRPLAEVPPTPTTPDPPAAAGSSSFTHGGGAVIATTALGVGAVLVGLLRRRRGRRDRAIDLPDDLLDAEVLLEQSASLPGINLTEIALLLAQHDGVMTSTSLLSVGGDGARLFVGGSQVWHAEPGDLVGAVPDVTSPPAALIPLGDRDGASWSLVVPSGCTGVLGGPGAEDFIDLSLALQSELVWGHRVRVIDNEDDLESFEHHDDGLPLTSNPSLRGTRLAAIVISNEGCQVRLDACGVDLVELGIRISAPGPIAQVADLIELPADATLPLPPADTIPATPSPRFTDAPPEPMLRLLTAEPRIDGLAQPIDAKRARRAVEVVAYIAVHDPDPVTGDRIRTRVLGSSSQDAAAKTLFNVTSAARRGLGLSSEGEPILPIADRSGRYRLGPVLTSDVAEFHAHLSCARRADDADAQMAHLRAALDLIEGEPLAAALSGWDWFTVEGHRARLDAAIEDTAIWLVDLALEAGLLDLAQLAIDRARPALPLSEDLAARAMEVAAAQGSLLELQRCFDDLGAILDEIDPGCWPVHAHEVRFGDLVQNLRCAKDQASLAAMDAAPRSTSPSAPAAL